MNDCLCFSSIKITLPTTAAHIYKGLHSQHVSIIYVTLLRSTAILSPFQPPINHELQPLSLTSEIHAQTTIQNGLCFNRIDYGCDNNGLVEVAVSDVHELCQIILRGLKPAFFQRPLTGWLISCSDVQISKVVIVMLTVKTDIQTDCFTSCACT